MERQSASLFSNCPWEEKELQESNVMMIPLGETKSKNNSIPPQTSKINNKETSTVTAFEETREGQPKAIMPNFFYKTAFGYPRYENLNYYRQLAASVYVDMCETAIIDEVCSVRWEIIAEDTAGNVVPGKEKEIEKIRKFFDNPNTNPGESWETIIRMMLPDLLEINSGILIKTFNAFGQMVEIVARDGVAFTKNPDPYGMYTDRADLILMKDPLRGDVENQNDVNYTIIGGLNDDQGRELGAYFQYGWNSATRPVPFGKREIIWIEKKVRTDNLYGRSSMAVLAKTVQTLIYAVEHNLEYFSDNSIPPGVLGLEGLSTPDMKAFAKQWIESQKVQDDLGNWKKKFHKLAMVNKKPVFERLGFSNQELQVIEQQKWWAKLVWAAFGMTSTELGFVEDSKGSANQIVQSSIAKKRIIYPILRLIEYYVNTQIIPEFGVEGIRYKYKIFDVDEETKKWELYTLQLSSKAKTINEIRNTEGLDPVEWGEKDPNPDPVSVQTGTDPLQSDANAINQDAQDQRDQMNAKPKEGKKALKDLDANTLEKGLDLMLEKNKKKVIDILESQTKKDPLVDIKGIDDIPGMIKNLFGVTAIKELSDAVIKEEYDGGWDNSEKTLDKNVQYNENALNFLQDMTFDNIKNMNDDVAKNLKAELSRGIINGEGITKLTARVNKVFDKGEVRAAAIARTETSMAENQGRLLAMKGSGVEMKKYLVITYDDRTSEVSKAMGRKYGSAEKAIGLDETFSVNVSGKEYSGQAPPFMPNDRDTVVFVVPDEE